MDGSLNLITLLMSLIAFDFRQFSRGSIPSTAIRAFGNLELMKLTVSSTVPAIIDAVFELVLLLMLFEPLQMMTLCRL